MAVFRVERNTGYTVMSNHHLRNKELSLKAKGLLSQMLSLPEDWDYTLAGLSYINREKIDAIREAVRELERAGYIQRSRERDEKGRLRGTDYIIYEQPPNLDLPTLENPTLGNPTLENPTQEKPTLENPMQLNKDIQKTDLPKKEKSNTDLSSNHSIPISCRAPGQERFTRLKTLGTDYTEEAIRERIEGKRTKAAKAPKEQRGVSLLIDIENSIKAQESRGYEQWAKIHNLKLAAKTMNFLTEHKIEQYADLVSRIEEVNAENEKTADALKSVEKRLADMAVLMKHVTTYQKTKPVYEAYRRAKDKDAYRAKQESSLILHEAAVKTLKAAGVTKLPNLAAMQEEYGKLQAQKEALYADYGKLKKQVKEYDVIKQNIDNILRQGKEPERKKGKERE